MASGIANKSGETLDALAARAANLERQIAERDLQLSWMRDSVAAMEAARLTAPAVEAEPAAKALSAPPPPEDREGNEISALAILAREGRAGSRQFWTQALARLGHLLAPDASVSEQQYAALRDPRGQDLLRAIQSARD